MPQVLVNFAYLVASILFILGLKGMAHPRTAVRGNFLGAVGMFIAVLVTVLDHRIIDYTVILAGLVVGSAIGTLLAVKVQMTAMPQMVALLNGFGGGASVLVAGAALFEAVAAGQTLSLQLTTATAASALIGAVTFSGSLIAFGKLQEVISGNAVVFPLQHLISGLVALASLALCVWVVVDPQASAVYWLLVAAALILGVLATIGIGGADMPVVISLLNSYSGLAATATGFVLENNVLIIAGSLVGASGIILTQIMCKAMNRSLTNVLFGGLGSAVQAAGTKGADVYAGKVKASSAEEVAMLLGDSRRVVIVPGYGLAVSQAQHTVRILADLLESRGAEVLYAIHPVAGRMPGHMNILLAEADVSYEVLKEMDEINPTFPQTDVAIVIGANDVVNPSARTDPKSPIAGMPILDVDKARTVVVIKRSLSPGFAGIPNPLFALDNTLLLFADAQKAVNDIVAALKENS
ncbi:MAG: NAD(P)(+) transhydrogenase (Re/Si-specific) subunit beta [Bryobacterales bacterium]|nr:NAD(P)(+) transhydrogenase (Re/Si-specific) subunit beta [Bryobacterales bacterium]